MRKLVAALSALLLVLGTLAQVSKDLQGTVTDEKGNPIHGASIVILNTDRGAVSGSTGEFLVKGIANGRYNISVSAIGYASKVVDFKMDGVNALSIKLSLSSELLDELVVSSEKTEEKQQRVASAVTAISGRQVREFRLWDIKEITGIVPNLYSANSGDYRNVTSIRGIATTSYEQAVATYVDGVNQFNLDTYIPQLLDIERIEVLRGPQGTLYGRNAMGGVINIITRKPGNTTDVYGEISAGNYGQQRYVLAVKTPIIKDKLFIGASGLFEKRNGYYTNEFNAKDFDSQDRFTGNYYLKFLPSSNFSATLNVKHQNNRNDGAFPLNPDKASAFDAPFTLNQNALALMKDDVFNSSLALNYNTSGVRIQSLTAWQSNERIYDAPLDGDFSPLDAISIINNYGEGFNKVKVFTEELRFQSRDLQNSRLKWTAGAFFFTQNNPTKQGTYFGNDAPLLGLPDSDFTLISTNIGENMGLAVFGQLNYKLSEKLELIAGLRYDSEKRKLTVSGEYEKGGSAFPTLADTSASSTFNAVSPKAGLQYNVGEDNMLYLIYSKGYRAGGFTTLGSDPSQVPLAAFDPEFSNNVELGWKYFIADRKLKLNMNLFYTFVDNVQTPTLILPDAITVIRNAGKLNSKGAEIELGATPIKGLELIVNAGVTDAEYTELKVPKDGQEIDLSGNKQVFSPSYTTLGVAQYSFAVGKSFNLSARIEARFLGKQYFDLANAISQDSYGLLNARVGVSHRKAELFLWGRNITDKAYIAYAYDFGGVHLGNPRTYGATLAFKL
jgi:iron complex outermembrane recepter protein